MAIQQQCSSQSSLYMKSCWMKIMHSCTNLPTFMLGNFSFLVKGFTRLLSDQEMVKCNKVLIASMITFTFCSFALNGSMMATFFEHVRLKVDWASHSSIMTHAMYSRQLWKASMMSYNGLMLTNKGSWQTHTMESFRDASAFQM